MSKKNKSKSKAAAQPAPAVTTTKQQRRPFVPVLGAPFTFTPAAFLQEKSAVLPGQQPVPRAVTGTITYINWAHGWFRVTYEVNGVELSQGIKF